MVQWNQRTNTLNMVLMSIGGQQQVRTPPARGQKGEARGRVVSLDAHATKVICAISAVEKPNCVANEDAEPGSAHISSSRLYISDMCTGVLGVDVLKFSWRGCSRAWLREVRRSENFAARARAQLSFFPRHHT